MRIVIVGAGMVGIQIARELIEEKRDVVLIEKNPETARMVDNELDCLVINADGSRPETLRMAHTESADWFIALTGSDAVNIVACGLVAAESRKTRTIARVETPFYSALSEVQQKTFGLDVLINPAMEAAHSLVHIIDEGFAESVIPLHDGELQLRTVPSGALPDFIGKTLGQMRQSSVKHFLIAAIARNSTIVVPKGDCRIEANDRLYVLGQPKYLDDLLGKVEGIGDQARRICLLGISRISESLIEILEEGKPKSAKSGFPSLQNPFRKKMDITLLDGSPDEGKQMVQRFPNINVLSGDFSDEGILESAGVSRSDLFIAATGSQANNIIGAELAKVLGAKKTIALVSNERFLPLGPRLDVDAYVCSNDAVVAAVLETVRKAHIRTIYNFYEDDVEIVELKVDGLSPVAGRHLMDIELPKDVLVAFVLKSGSIVVPSGQTTLDGGDVIGLVTPKNSISILEAIFGGNNGI